MDSQNLHDRIDAYLSFLSRYPHLADNTQSQIPVVIDRETLLSEQVRLYQMADRKNQPREWYQLGIVAQDAWVVVLRDLVRFPNGSHGGYIRTLNRRSQVECSGKDVVILVTIDDKYLLLKHFRHDDRMWHWECPRGFGEADLTPSVNAEKEVTEETGLQIVELRQLNNETESIAYFHARCVGVPRTYDTEESISEYVLADIQTLNMMLADGRISDPYTVRAITLSRIK